MKKAIKWIAVAVSVGVINTAAAGEVAEVPCWYVHGDAGLSFMHDLEDQNSSASAEMDLGVRADVALGYNFNQNWAAEFEAGFIWNEFSDAPVNLYQIPLLINGIYRIPMDNGLTPYFGVGIGGVASIFDVDVSGVGSDTDFTFAWQAQAGVKYALSEKIAIDLGYKLLGTLEHEWTVGGGTTETEGTWTHAVLLSITFNL